MQEFLSLGTMLFSNESFLKYFLEPFHCAKTLLRLSTVNRAFRVCSSQVKLAFWREIIEFDELLDFDIRTKSMQITLWGLRSARTMLLHSFFPTLHTPERDCTFLGNLKTTLKCCKCIMGSSMNSRQASSTIYRIRRGASPQFICSACILKAFPLPVRMVSVQTTRKIQLCD